MHSFEEILAEDADILELMFSTKREDEERENDGRRSLKFSNAIKFLITEWNPIHPVTTIFRRPKNVFLYLLCSSSCQCTTVLPITSSTIM